MVAIFLINFPAVKPTKANSANPRNVIGNLTMLQLDIYFHTLFCNCKNEKLSKITKLFLILLLSIVYSSCNNPYAIQEVKFIPDIWINIEDKVNRESMLMDLCKSHIKIGLDRDSVIKLLGLPDIVLDSNELKPKGVFWYKNYPDEKNEADIQDSLLYVFYTEVDGSSIAKIDRYTVGFNGSGPNYMLMVYNQHNKLVDYTFERVEF